MSKKCITCGQPPAQQPYYKNVGNETTQDHASIFRDTQYAAGLVISDAFQIPAVDTDIQVCVKNAIDVVVGSYLWHPAYGSLKIVYWDGCKKKIGLLNEGLTGTAAPGTSVPECTAFVPSSRPCCADQDNFQLFPFLAQDFEAPGVGQSRTIQVTSTFGLIEGTYVRIGTGVYFLESINSSLEVVITNDGAGATPGDIVEALDADGNLQYLLTGVAASACTSPGSETVQLIGCDGANEAILEGDYEDQVPVLINPSTEEVHFKLLDTTVRVCTSLLTAVNLTPGIGAYTFEVDDASVFTIGEILEAQTSDLRFEITNITVNDIDVTSVPNPSGVTETLQVGIWICKILTTEDLQDQVDVIVTGLDSEYLRLDGTNEASLAANVIELTKIETINTDRLLGRDTAGVGNVEELTVTGGLEFTSSGGIQRSALTGDVTAAAASGATAIAALAVTTAKIAADAVTSAKIRLANATALRLNNLAGTAVDVLQIDASDDTLINSDAGNGIKLGTAGAYHWYKNSAGDLTVLATGQDIADPTTRVDRIHANQFNPSSSLNVAAAGTLFSDATLLTATVNIVTSGAAASGVRLPSGVEGDIIVVKLTSANQIGVYPPTGGTIDGAGANVAITLNQNNSWILFYRAATDIRIIGRY